MTTTQPSFTKQIATDDDMQALGALLAAVVTHGTVISLIGPLGAGKTTFVRGFLRGLGYQGKVKSPTYTLVEPYDIEQGELFHFDLYRLNTPDELEAIGIEEYFTPTSICLIEWPEKGGRYLPASDLTIKLTILECDTRAVSIHAGTVEGKDVLARILRL